MGKEELRGAVAICVHRLPRPRGWKHQLQNEPGLVLTYTRKWQYFGETVTSRLERDLSPHIVGALGNVYTYAGGGVLFRVGRELRRDGGPETDFRDSPIFPRAVVVAGTRSLDSRPAG